MLLWQADQMGTADAAVLSAASGSPTVVVVEGAEGTGKSSFLDELADRAVGFDVLDAGGFESAAEHPFGILEQWGAINGLGSPPPASPFVGAKLLHELLDRHADGGPVLLRLDDLQWADRESVEALTWMLQRASGDRLLVGIASRPLLSTTHPAWQRWSSGRGRVLPVPLTGLTLEDATRLLRDVRPDLNAATARRLWEHTAGNPSYLAALLAEYDGADLATRRWLPAPRAFAEAIDAQSHRLSGDALALVRAVAVLGADWCSLADAGALASVEHPTDAAYELVEQGLLRTRAPDAGAAVRVAQPILHSAIYEQIPPGERRALHGAAAGIVPRTEDVLGHRIAAVERYDDALAMEIDAWASYLHEVSLHRLAARHLRAAAWLSSAPRDRERRWLDSLFESLLAQDTGVVRAVERKVEDAEDVVRRDLVLGALATFEDDNHEAVYWFGKQLDVGDRAVAIDPLTHYRIEVLLAWARIQGGADTGLVAAGLERADGIAARDPALLSWHVAAGGLVAKRTRPVRDLLGELADLPENPAAVPWEARNVLGWRGDLRADSGLVGPSIVDLEHVVSMVDEGGLEAALPHRHALLGLSHWFAGQWNKARLHLRLALDLGASESPVAAAIVPLLDIGTGELEEADRKTRAGARAARAQPMDGGVRPPRHRDGRAGARRRERGPAPGRGVRRPARHRGERAIRRAGQECALAGPRRPRRPLGRGAGRRRRVPPVADDELRPGSALGPLDGGLGAWARGRGRRRSAAGPRRDRARGSGPGQRPPALSRAHAARPGPVGSRPRRPRPGSASA